MTETIGNSDSGRSPGIKETSRSKKRQDKSCPLPPAVRTPASDSKGVEFHPANRFPASGFQNCKRIHLCCVGTTLVVIYYNVTGNCCPTQMHLGEGWMTVWAWERYSILASIFLPTGRNVFWSFLCSSYFQGQMTFFFPNEILIPSFFAKEYSVHYRSNKDMIQREAA